MGYLYSWLISLTILFSKHFQTSGTLNSGIRFKLYPFRSNPSIFEDVSSFPQDGNMINFNPNQTTVIIIHGFYPKLTSFTPLEIKNAFLSSDDMLFDRINCIYLDWSTLATPNDTTALGILQAYPNVVFAQVPYVSRKLASFVDALFNSGLVSYENIHFIGYSLGAHVAGLSGRMITWRNGGVKVGRVTGLDPALPLFRNMWRNEWATWRLGKQDADFVDVYYTSMSISGALKFKGKREDGHVEFYPNGGKSPQPGCLSADLRIPFICSHLFSVRLFIETIHGSRFPACKCEPLVDFWMLGVVCLGNCREAVLAGQHCPKSAHGKYFFTTSQIGPNFISDK